MDKDPAALFYISDWLKSTKGMKADAKGWYLNLILFQFDLGDLPDDIEELANLCDVRISEFEKFKQVFKDVLEPKFQVNENGRLENQNAKTIIQKREIFKQKRSDAGRMSYFIKFGIRHFKISKPQISFIKDTVNLSEINLKDVQVLKHLFKHTLELYKNETGNGNKSKTENLEKRVAKFKMECLTFKSKYPEKMISEFFNYWSEINKSKTKMAWELKPTFEISKRLATWKSKYFNNKPPQNKFEPADEYEKSL